MAKGPIEGKLVIAYILGILSLLFLQSLTPTVSDVSGISSCGDYVSVSLTAPAGESLDTANLEGVSGEWISANCDLDQGMIDVLKQEDPETGDDVRCLRYKETIPLGKAEGAFKNHCYKPVRATIRCLEVCP